MSGVSGATGVGVHDLARGYSKSDAGLGVPPKEISFGDGFTMQNYERMGSDPQDPSKTVDRYRGGFLDRSAGRRNSADRDDR